MPGVWGSALKRRVSILIALYLLFGLVATVAVAWGSAWMWSPNDLVRQIHDRDGPPHRSASEWRCWGGRMYELEDALDSEMLARERQQNLSQSWVEFDVKWPSIASPLIAYDEGGVANPVAFVEARGWPWIAVRCELEITPEDWSWFPPTGRTSYWLNRASNRDALVTVFPPDLSVRGALEGPDIRDRFYSPSGKILLPYLPYWPGLIADTLVFAAAFAGLHQLVGLARRAMRRKPGMCVKCGYDLTGIEGVCPECGSLPQSSA